MAVKEIISTEDMFKTETKDVISSDEMFTSPKSKVTSEPVPQKEIVAGLQEDFLKSGLESGEIVPVEPTFIENLKRKWPQYVGGGVGSLAVHRAMKPQLQQIKHPALRLLAEAGTLFTGGFLGGMGGKGYQQLYQMNKPGAKPQTLSELYTDQLLAGLEEGASEVVGFGIAKGLGKSARFLSKSPMGRAIKSRLIDPGAKKAAALLRKYNIGITLAQTTQNRIIDLMESISEGSIAGGGYLQRLKTVRIPQAILKEVDSISGRFTTALGKLSREEIGDIIFDALTKENTTFKHASKSLYKQVDKLIKRSGKVGLVNIKALQKFSKSRLQSKVNILRSQTGDTLLESIMALPENITFKQATSLRSSLLTYARTMSSTKDVALGATKQLAKLADNAIEKTGKNLSGDALTMWRFANKFHREGKELFNEKLIKDLTRLSVNRQPEKIIPRIFQKGASKQIKLLKNTVDKDTWDVLKHGYVESILQKGKIETGEFVGKNFLNNLDDDVLKATLSTDEIKMLKDLGEAAELLQRPASAFGSTGRIVVAMSQAGVITGSAFKKKPGFAATILFTPYAMSRIVTNKKWNRMLLDGIQDPVKFSSSLARLARVATQFDMENLANRRKQEFQDRLESVKEPFSPFTGGPSILNPRELIKMKAQ